MTKKKIARKVCLALFLVLLIYITVNFFLGKTGTFFTIFMFGCYLFLAMYSIILKIKRYKTYKCVVKTFELLHSASKSLYKLYFTGNREEIEKYSSEIDRFWNDLLNIERIIISNNMLGKKYTKNVKEILNQTEMIINNKRAYN